MSSDPRLGAWEAIASYRAVREFADRALEPDHLRRIVSAGRRAASSKNQQRWDFIVCRDRAHLRELSTVGRYADHVAGAAVAIALVTPDPRAHGVALSLLFDIGQAAGFMAIAARELGIGSCPATVYDQSLARRLLGYPADRWCEYMLSFGYPADSGVLTAPLRPGGRRPIDDIVHEERW